MTDHCIVLATITKHTPATVNYYKWDTSTSAWKTATAQTKYDSGDNVYLTFYIDPFSAGATSPKFNFSPFARHSITPDTIAAAQPSHNPPKVVSGVATAHSIGSGCPDTFNFTSSYITASGSPVDPDGTIVVEN